MAEEPYESLSLEQAQSTNQAKPLNEGKATYPNDPASQEEQHRTGNRAMEAKPDHPEHPQGGPPGQTGEHPDHPQGGPPGQDKPKPDQGAPAAPSQQPGAPPAPSQQSRHR